MKKGIMPVCVALFSALLIMTFALTTAIADDSNTEVTIARSFFESGALTDRAYLYLLERQAETDQQAADKLNDLGKNWMAGISGERYLNEINIPGTHDSGMAKPRGLGMKVFGEQQAKTQSLSIKDQLDAGIRMLDLRLYYKYEYYEDTDAPWGFFLVEQDDDGENLWVIHGKNEDLRYWGLNPSNHSTKFKEVLGWVKDFLKNHPTETVILYIRPETEDSWQKKHIMQRAVKILEQEMVRERNPRTGLPYLYIENYPWKDDYFSYPQLKSCRGMAVIRCWGGYHVGGMDLEALLEPYGEELSSDEYQLSGQAKVECIADYYNDHYISLPDSENEHFPQVFDVWLNGTATPVVGSTPMEIAQLVNNYLFGEKYYSEDDQYVVSPLGNTAGTKYVGWVHMDDASSTYAKKIWKKNFYYHGDGGAPITVITVNTGLPGQDLPQTYAVLRENILNTTITIPSDIYSYDPEALGKYLIGWESDGQVYYPGDELLPVAGCNSINTHCHYAVPR